MVPFRVSLSPKADTGCVLLLLFNIILIVLGPLSPRAVYCFSHTHPRSHYKGPELIILVK